MAQVTLQVYHTDGAARERVRRLVETRYLTTESAKALTAKRASQIIARELPAFAGPSGVRVIRTEDGWLATRTLRATESCAYHYVWEEVVVRDG